MNLRDRQPCRVALAAIGIALLQVALPPDSGAQDIVRSPAIHPLRAGRMEEWNDWRFGMFIHWGPWAQTGVGYI